MMNIYGVSKNKFSGDIHVFVFHSEQAAHNWQTVFREDELPNSIIRTILPADEIAYMYGPDAVSDAIDTEDLFETLPCKIFN